MHRFDSSVVHSPIRALLRCFGFSNLVFSNLDRWTDVWQYGVNKHNWPISQPKSRQSFNVLFNKRETGLSLGCEICQMFAKSYINILYHQCTHAYTYSNKNHKMTAFNLISEQYIWKWIWMPDRTDNWISRWMQGVVSSL